MADAKISALPAASALVGTEKVACVQSSATVAATATQIAALALIPSTNDFRLTLTTLTPVTTSDVTGGTSLYLTPYKGSYIATYDTATWTLHTSAEISVALANVVSGKNYDVFLFLNSSTLTLVLAPAWTNDTTRASALAQQDGVWVNNATLTDVITGSISVTAKNGRYLGTIRASGTNTVDDVGSPAAGTSPKRFLFNQDNRVPRTLKVIDVTSHTYGTNTTRQWRAQTFNRLEFVLGQATSCWASVIADLATASSGYAVATLGLDSTTTEDFQTFINNPSALSQELAGGAAYPYDVGIGYHLISVNERAVTATGSFNQMLGLAQILM